MLMCTELILAELHPDYRDEARAILEYKVTDGPIGRCLTRNVDRYAMAAWDRELAHAVATVRPYWLAMAMGAMLLLAASGGGHELLCQPHTMVAHLQQLDHFWC
jgi:hypothetical protein